MEEGTLLLVPLSHPDYALTAILHGSSPQFTFVKEPEGRLTLPGIGIQTSPEKGQGFLGVLLRLMQATVCLLLSHSTSQILKDRLELSTSCCGFGDQWSLFGTKHRLLST